MTDYKAGGKGQAPRRSFEPRWVGLEEVCRKDGYVEFLTPRGRLYVIESEVERWECSQKMNGGKK